jgi:hypothetical protein
MSLWGFRHTRIRSHTPASDYYRPGKGWVILLLLNICLCVALHFGVTGSWKDTQAIISFSFLGVLLVVGVLVLFLKRSYPRDRITYSSWTMLILSNMWGASFLAFNHFLRKSPFTYALALNLTSIAIWLQAVQGYKPGESSINILATMGALYCATSAITMLYALNPPSRWKALSSSHLIFSFVLMALGSGLSSTFQIHTPLGKMIGYQILFGVGAGLGGFQAMVGILSLILPGNEHTRIHIETRDILKIITRSAIAEALGGASSISIAHTVFLGQAIPGRTFIQKIGATNFRNGLEGPVLDASVAAFNKAITRTFLVAAAPNAFAFALCVLSGIVFFRFGRTFKRRGQYSAEYDDAIHHVTLGDLHALGG